MFLIELIKAVLFWDCRGDYRMVADLKYRSLDSVTGFCAV